MSNGNVQLIRWLKENDPFLLEVAKQRHAIKENSLNGPFDAFGSFINNVVNTVKEVAPALINLKGQKKILDIQLKRAEQNLPPIKAENYTPTIRVAPTITPETREAAKQIAYDTAKNAGQQMMLPAILIGGGLIYFATNRRRR